MLTRNHRQEAFSRAYVRAVAAQAGVIVCEPESDYGIDMTLRTVELRDKRRRDVGTQIDLQLKSTTQATVGTGEVSYDLEVLNYDDLREANLKVPRLLVVLVLPEDEQAWLSQSPDELILRRCAYWISLAGHAATKATTTIRVKIPLANVFSVAALQDLCRRI